MALNNFLISFLLHLGMLLSVTADEYAYAIAGQRITLPCPGVNTNSNPGTVSWKHNGTKVLRYIEGKPWQVPPKKDKYKGTGNREFSLEMPQAEEGVYTCDGSGEERNIHLHFLKVTGSPEGYLLQGESLELRLHLPDPKPTKIEWIAPHHEKGPQPRWSRMDNDRILQIKNLQVQDNGTWHCSVHGLIIPYKVTVIGFLKAPDEEIFAAVNSTVTLSYVFNFNPQDEKYNTVKVHQTQETSGKPTSPNGSGTCSERKIPKVQFEDAGQYQCHIGLGHRPLNKTTHLVVMKVFANHTGPLLEDDRISLCCIISAPLPPRAVLRWDAANASTDVPHCLVIRTAGLRTCSLIVAGEVKINMSYAVEAAVGQIQFPPTNVVLGAGVPFVLLILLSVCLFVYIAIKRKKQRVERMIQAKQHLLAKRTCQCQREQSNDYYHT